jgi:hypothetical protein
MNRMIGKFIKKMQKEMLKCYRALMKAQTIIHSLFLNQVKVIVILIEINPGLQKKTKNLCQTQIVRRKSHNKIQTYRVRRAKNIKNQGKIKNLNLKNKIKLRSRK